MSQHKISRSVQFLPWGGWLGYLVRRATMDDLEFVTDELSINAQFYGKPLSTTADLRSEYSQKILTDFIINHVFLICMKDDERVGLMVGYIHKHLFNPLIKSLSEMLLWVKESYRNTRAAHILMKEYSRIADDFDFATMALNTKSNIKISSLEKLGFKRNEIILTKEKGVL